MNVKYIYVEVVIPTVTLLGLAIALPYAASHSVLPLFGKRYRLFWFVKSNRSILFFRGYAGRGSALSTPYLPVLASRYHCGGISGLAIPSAAKSVDSYPKRKVHV